MYKSTDERKRPYLNINTRLSARDYARLKKRVIDERTTVADVVADLILGYLARGAGHSQDNDQVEAVA